MHFLQAINSDCQTRLLNVFGQIAVFWEIKKKEAKYSSKGATPNGGKSEHSNEPTASIREGNFIDELSYNYRYLLKRTRTMDG